MQLFGDGADLTAALAELLAGDFNPSGKITQSWPVTIGQQPVNYNRVPGWHATRYVDLEAEPLFPFGHGLSYTHYRYSGLEVEAGALAAGGPLRAQVTVTNTGSRDGVEIVQCYLSDRVTSAAAPERELKAWRRVALKAGEAHTVAFEIPLEALALVDACCRRVVEAGAFELMIGPSSREGDLLRASFSISKEVIP